MLSAHCSISAENNKVENLLVLTHGMQNVYIRKKFTYPIFSHTCTMYIINLTALTSGKIFEIENCGVFGDFNKK